MTELQRLVLDFRTEKLVARSLYRSKGDSNPGTKEVASLTRTGLEQALDALEGGAECEGTSGIHHKGGCSFGHSLIRPRGQPIRAASQRCSPGWR
jgi:hypothetical protein